MVATSLPFWMQQPSRTMLPFHAEATLRARPKAHDGRQPPTWGSDSGPVVELCGPGDIENHADAWRALASRAIEPNVFMEPGFALPAVRHFLPAQRPRFLLVWQAGEQPADGAPMLIGILALDGHRHFGARAGSAWRHPLWVTSAPLLDRDRGGAALDAMLGWLARDNRTSGGLVVRGVAVDGPLMALLQGGFGRRVEILDQRTRAILRRPDVGGPEAALSGKRAKELRRQRRRLGADGACEAHSARSVDEVRIATERFLDLEARGWKGTRGTALLCDPRLATFTRTMTRLMARQGLCRIDTLDVDGRTVAAGIVLRSGERAYFWKTAYDERHSRQSPGKLLTETLGANQRLDPTVALTDSCANPDHPMIDRLWKDRMIVVDAVVSGPANSARAAHRAAVRLRAERMLRDRAKWFVLELRGRLLRR